MSAERKQELLDALEGIADYAAMIKGGLGHLRDAGLSDFASESVLLYLLGIEPGFHDEDDDEWEDWDEEDE